MDVSRATLKLSAKLQFPVCRQSGSYHKVARTEMPSAGLLETNSRIRSRQGANCSRNSAHRTGRTFTPQLFGTTFVGFGPAAVEALPPRTFGTISQSPLPVTPACSEGFLSGLVLRPCRRARLCRMAEEVRHSIVCRTPRRCLRHAHPRPCP